MKILAIVLLFAALFSLFAIIKKRKSLSKFVFAFSSIIFSLVGLASIYMLLFSFFIGYNS